MRNRCEDSRSAAVKCPFFRGHSPREIGCEGFEELSDIRMIFASQIVRDYYEYRFCAGKYHTCPLYPLIFHKYESLREE